MIRGSTSVAGDCSMNLEALSACQTAMDVCNQYGTPLDIKVRGESAIRRDSLGAIISRDISPRMTMYAHPVERSPDRRKLDKAGLREEVDVAIYTPLQAWVNAGIIDLDRLGDTFEAIDMTRWTVIMDGIEWKLSDKGLSVRVGALPLYVTLGLRRT